jgi:hypothetical protein
MKTFKNSSVWMAVMTFTAVVLAIIMLSSHSRDAKAAMMLDQSGFSMLTSGNGGDEVLVVIDKSTQRMIGYHLNNNNTFDIVGAYSMR